LYHIQWKFRDEIRPRFGILRGREFLMKDGYSFDLDRERAERSYQKMFACYLRTFARLGVRAVPVKAATGPIGGDLSHEFIVLAESGESEIYTHRALGDMRLDEEVDYEGDVSSLFHRWTRYYAMESGKHDAQQFESEIAPEDRLITRGIEVGHIFYFADKYSKSFDAQVIDAKGNLRSVYSGSYGIGVSRLVGAIIEASHDDQGIVWPEAVAPFAVGLINLQVKEAACVALSERLYDDLRRAKIEVLYDDRDERAGVKFANMDLIGLPYRLVISPRNMAQGVVEIKSRRGEGQLVALEQVLPYLEKELYG